MIKIGKKIDVWKRRARQTSGGLLRQDLMINKKGKVVSRKASESAKKLGKVTGGSRAYLNKIRQGKKLFVGRGLERVLDERVKIREDKKSEFEKLCEKQKLIAARSRAERKLKQEKLEDFERHLGEVDSSECDSSDESSEDDMSQMPVVRYHPQPTNKSIDSFMNSLANKNNYQVW